MLYLIAQYFKVSVAMKSQLGIFLNAPERTKILCLIFQASDIENTLVKPSTENRWMFGSLSVQPDAAASLTQGIFSSGAHLVGKTPPAFCSE